MKLSALAVVLLALGIVLGLTLGSTATEAAPPAKWATPQFVADSIEAFNQAVVQPISTTVAQLQGEVSDLDQRVTALETTPPPQSREAEITIYAGDGSSITGDVWPTFDTRRQVAVDGTRYPSGAEFVLEVSIWDLDAGGTACVELVDITANPSAVPLTGTSVADACATGTAGEYGTAVGRSIQFTPTPGQRIYTIRGRDIDNGTVPKLSLARIIVEWTE